jgi:hypothetical protein
LINSLLIFFDHVRRPDLGLVGILPGRPERAALAEKIPALIKFDFNRPQPRTLLLGERLLRLEPMLLRYKFLNVPKH